MPSKPQVLVIDSGDFERSVVERVCEQARCECKWAEQTENWSAAFSGIRPDVVLADENAGFLPPVMQKFPEVPLILVVQDGRGRLRIIQSVFCAVQKPVSYTQLAYFLQRALLYSQVALTSWRDTSQGIEKFLGNSEIMRRLYSAADGIGSSRGNVLICGERGTGRERLARYIWKNSAGTDRALHVVDCRDVRDSTFFRLIYQPLINEKGVATGTLFLGEISALSHSSQQQLLDSLCEGRIISDGIECKIEVRVIASTGDSLERLVAENRFLSNLTDLIAQHRLNIPPLRHHVDDISFLADTVVGELANASWLNVSEIPSATRFAMTEYKWPGNVKELRKLVAKAGVLKEGIITPTDLDLTASLKSGKTMPIVFTPHNFENCRDVDATQSTNSECE